MKRYSEYKDSGIEWLGKIPKHWDIKRFKYIYRLKKGKTPETLSTSGVNDYPYLTMEYLRGNPDQIYYCINIKNMVTVKDGDLLLLWDGSNAGEFITAKNGVLSSTMAKLSLIKGERKYFYFVLKHNERVLREFTIGMGIPHVSGDFLQDLLMPVPEIKEQESIADFLDNKTMQIDDLITKKEQMIELLKEERTAIINQAVTKGLDPNVEMKDSRIEWIGEIPKHWDIKRFKYIYRLKKGKTPETLSTSGVNDYPYLTMEYLRGNPDQIYYCINIKNMVTVKDGDLLLLWDGSNAGEFITAKNGVLSSTMAKLSLIKGEKKYFYFVLKHNERILREFTIGMGIPHVSGDFLQDLLMPVPEIKEQESIADFLDKKTTQIDTQVEREKKSIELLREYRTALISEVVTGKIDVREN